MAHKKYGEETQLISIRVPKSKVAEVKKMVNDYISKPIDINNHPAFNETLLTTPADHNKGCKCVLTQLKSGIVVYIKKDKECKLSKEQHNF